MDTEVFENRGVDVDMDTEFFENRGVDMDMDTKFFEKRGVDMDMDTEFLEKRGVDLDMDTVWNRCPPNSAGAIFGKNFTLSIYKSWGTYIGHQHHNTPECDVGDWYLMLVPNSW